MGWEMTGASNGPTRAGDRAIRVTETQAVVQEIHSSFAGGKDQAKIQASDKVKAYIEAMSKASNPYAPSQAP